MPGIAGRAGGGCAPEHTREITVDDVVGA